MQPRPFLALFCLGLAVASLPAGASQQTSTIKVMQAGAVVVGATAGLGELVHVRAPGAKLDGYTTLAQDGTSNHYQYLVDVEGKSMEFDVEAPAESCMQRVLDPVRQIAIRACATE